MKKTIYLVKIILPNKRVFRVCRKKAINPKDAAERCKSVHPYWYKIIVSDFKCNEEEVLYSCESFNNLFLYSDNIVLK